MLAQILMWAAAHPAAAVCACILMLLVAKDLSRRLLVRGIPGPKVGTMYPLLGNLPSVLPFVRQGRMREYLTKNSEANGWKTWAVWNPMISEIVLTTPEATRHMLNTHFNHYKLPKQRGDALHSFVGDGIFNSDGARWKEQRAFASHLFSAGQLKRRMAHVFQQNAAKVRSVLESVKAGEAVDMEKLMYSYTFDAIAEIAFGTQVDSLGGVACDVEFQRAFDAMQERSTQRLFDLFWKVKKFLNVGAEAQMARDLDIVEDYIKMIISKRESMEGEDGSDLLSIFDDHCASSGHKPTFQERRDLVLNFLIAGRDTTASVLTWTWWELSHHHDVRDTVETDIKQNADPDAMEYTQAVFQEVLRMHPSVHMDSKECVKDDVLPDGTKVRKGCLVGFHPAMFCQNPNLYPEPHKFNPGRWMGEDGRCCKYDQYAYPCFNAGPRICLGRHMAALEAKHLLSEVMSAMRVQIKKDHVPELKHTIVLQTRNGMLCTVEKRSE